MTAPGAKGYGRVKVGGRGRTALVGTADKGHYAVVCTLLQHPETDPNTRDNQGELGG
jgi:hypothetical protein